MAGEGHMNAVNKVLHKNLQKSIDRRIGYKNSLISTSSSSELKFKEISKDNLETESLSNFDYNIAAVDSLIINNAPNEEIYKKMGMSDNAGFFEKRVYAQGLKFYKSRKGGSMLQAFYDAMPIAMFFLLPICQSQMSAKKIGETIHQVKISRYLKLQNEQD